MAKVLSVFKDIKFDRKKLNQKKILINSSLLFVGLLGLICPILFSNVGDFLSFGFFFLRIIGIIGIIFAAYSILIGLNFFGFDRIKTVSIFIGIVSGAIFILTDIHLTLFDPIQEFSLDARFRISAFEFTSQNVTEGVIQHRKNPKAHPAVQIIGIDNPTVNEYQNFPFSWKHYAELLKSLDNSKPKVVMFDIFFLDAIKDRFASNKRQKRKIKLLYC